MQRTIRLLLTSVLIYAVWKETGWATATAIALISLAQEVASYAMGNVIKYLNILKQRGA